MAEHLPMERFAQNAAAALRNTTQRNALRAAADVFDGRRKNVLETAPEWQQWRQHARAVKNHVLAHLDHYLAEFERNATARGAVVHWAQDADVANAIVADLAAGHGNTVAVKSKSMTTEEIHLNAALADVGVEAVETDLGEWIQQLADEVPFHIVVPAIHKNRRQVAELFAEKLGTSSDADAEALTRAARDRLRDRFARAGVGISGANFLVAETGSILILENEGNARLTTSVPRMHIAVVGIEKVLPRLADLDVFLRLLPRSGTGQQLTTYQSILTGKTPVGGEGPEELHIVLLDNGRSRMLKEEVTRQSLACIRCGACLNVCPVYQQVGGHAYGSVYPGPIGAVITPQLAPLERAAELPFASSLCGACRDVCPVAIDIPQLLLHLRQQVREGDDTTRAAKPQLLERLALRAALWLLRSPRRYRSATRFWRWAEPWFGWLAHRLPPLSRWRQGRTVPRLARRDFISLWQERRRR
ncbi:MAG: iron-sulfur cluster-binding protein [Planctomycetes bacterium]|nr:iron-sulfur cluster-binding protein [Planctomycetota bacterium]